MKTFSDTLYLIFDMDWAADHVIQHTLDILEAHQARATFFLTNDSPLVRGLRGRQDIELGLHPNLPPNPQAPRPLEDPGLVLQDLRGLAPQSTSIRCHSLLNSTRLLELFAASGFRHEVSCYIPASAGLTLRPWRLWNGLIRVPFFWEDDINCLYGHGWQPQSYLDHPGLKVMAFHPIHVYLNMAQLEDYGRARPWLDSPERLAGLRRPSEAPGVASFLHSLLGLARRHGLAFGTISEITP
ncbi:MAG: hypothetical protein HY794_06975 [Desulfarculus sp.]|nr:hypothetical protein [Desulfarculus sp.]